MPGPRRSVRFAARPHPLHLRARTRTLDVLRGTLRLSLLSPPASAVGTFEASVMSCSTPPGGGDAEGKPQARISGAPPGTAILPRVVPGNVTGPPPRFVPIGGTP
jgi:hypothetical protein